jgi:hypothetical protein
MNELCEVDADVFAFWTKIVIMFRLDRHRIAIGRVFGAERHHKLQLRLCLACPGFRHVQIHQHAWIVHPAVGTAVPAAT